MSSEVNEDVSIVTTRNGPVVGRKSENAFSFYNIPYCTAGRFEKPQPVASWSDPRDAIAPGPAAPQSASRLDAVMGSIPFDTDETSCLTVNVWTPDPGGRAPVLLWFHGGAWLTGSGGSPWYDGLRLAAEQGIVVVTANYRLGALGYLYLNEIDSKLGAGNFGLADQSAALEWVSREIGKFGGDPSLITVGGQSAGAHSAGLLASSPETRDLTARLMMQSSPHNWPLATTDEATETAVELLADLAIDRKDATAILRVPTSEIVSATARIMRRRAKFSSVIPPLRPVQSDCLPSATVHQALSYARDDLDVLVGYTSDEMRAFFDTDPTVSRASEDDVVAELDRRYGDGVEVYRRFRSSPEMTPGRVLGTAIGDSDFVSSAKQVAMSRARQARPAHVYEFGWDDGQFGACHCVDLPFLFGNQTAWVDAPMLTSMSRDEFDRLSSAFMSCVGQFVRTANPGWRPFSGEHGEVEVFA